MVNTNILKLMDLLRPTFFACMILGWFPASGSELPSWKETKLKGVMVPLYLKNRSDPSAVIRIGRIFSSYQRKGFFRIGVLPILVAEDVKIELWQPEQVAESLAATRGWIGAHAAKEAMEWRRLSLFLPGQTSPCLKAGRVQPSDHGQWRLFDVELHPGPKTIHLPTAFLQTTGKDAGRLSWTADRPESVWLLAPGRN